MDQASCIRVMTIEWTPYTTIINRTDGSHEYIGIYFDLLRSAADKYNFCYAITPSAAQTWGDLPNGSFAGALGAIQKEEHDLLLTPSTISITRFKAFEFSKVVEIDAHTIMYHYPDREMDPIGYVRPFSINTWILILVGSFVLMWILKILLDASNHLIKRIHGRNQVPGTMGKSFFGILGGLTGQPARFKLDTEAIKIGFCLWIMCAFIVTSVYKSNLVAMLSTPRLKIPFQTLEEAISQDKIRIIINRGSYIDQTITASNEGTSLKKLSDVAKRENFYFIDFIGRVTQKVFAIASIKGGLEGLIARDFIAKGHCTMTNMKGTFLPVFMAIAFPKNSTLVKKFNRIVTGYVESGIFQQLESSVLRKATFCILDKQAIAQDVRALSLNEFYGIFILYLYGMGLSAVIFVLEIVVEKFSKISKPSFMH